MMGGNYYWSLKALTVYFEHVCSVERVMGTLTITAKSATMTCHNCHKKYFYRKVDLPNAD